MKLATIPRHHVVTWWLFCTWKTPIYRIFSIVHFIMPYLCVRPETCIFFHHIGFGSISLRYGIVEEHRRPASMTTEHKTEYICWSLGQQQTFYHVQASLIRGRTDWLLLHLYFVVAEFGSAIAYHICSQLFMDEISSCTSTFLFQR